jgi:hypothetical protein
VGFARVLCCNAYKKTSALVPCYWRCSARLLVLALRPLLVVVVCFAHLLLLLLLLLSLLLLLLVPHLYHTQERRN